MDLGAYTNKHREEIESWFGFIPRPRGVRLMRFQEESTDSPSLFNEYCGKDVIYIHTRCGGDEHDDCTNYYHNNMGEFEKNNNCIGAQNDEWDKTYRDSYFNVPEKYKQRYNEIIKEIEKQTEAQK